MSNNKEFVLTVNDADDALQLIERLQNGEEITFPDRIELGGDLGKLVICIEGGNYHSSVPGNFARGIWEFQQEIYRAVAATTQGVTDLRKLPKEAYEQYNLVFEVSSGSSNLEAPTSGFFTALGKGLSDMDDRNKLIAILGIAAIISLGYAGGKIGASWISSHYSSQAEQARLEADVEKERERTKQIEMLTKSNATIRTFDKAVTAGTKSVIKSVPDATEATVAGATFDRQAILDVNSRAARESRDSMELTEDFKIIGFKRPEGSDIGRYTLVSKSGEISAILDMSEDGPFTPEQIQHFWDAGLTQNPITLTVGAKLVGGAVKQALVSDIHIPQEVD